jgi:hypothetical protein
MPHSPFGESILERGSKRLYQLLSLTRVRPPQIMASEIGRDLNGRKPISDTVILAQPMAREPRSARMVPKKEIQGSLQSRRGHKSITTARCWKYVGVLHAR